MLAECYEGGKAYAKACGKKEVSMFRSQKLLNHGSQTGPSQQHLPALLYFNFAIANSEVNEYNPKISQWGDYKKS